jgi:hypothetical protein
MQKVRGVLVAVLIGVAVFTFVTVWLHAVPVAALIISSAVALAVVLVVTTRTDSNDEAADAAWREAAPDLPPVSDRRALEVAQASMPGPRDAATPRAGELQDPGAGI